MNGGRSCSNGSVLEHTYCMIERTWEVCPDAEKARPDRLLIRYVLAVIFRVLSPINPYKKHAKPQEKEAGDQLQIFTVFLPFFLV
jgi:hypothetical protein